MEQAQLRQVIIDFLNNHRKAVFAISDEQGLPTTSLMLYVIDDEMNVFFGTRKAFAKYQHIINQPIVSLSVVEEALDPLKAVDVRGTVEQLNPHDQEKVHAWFKQKILPNTTSKEQKILSCSSSPQTLYAGSMRKVVNSPLLISRRYVCNYVSK